MEHVRHEEVAAFAAGAEAAATGRLAVCAGSCGPGNLHLINGGEKRTTSGAAIPSARTSSIAWSLDVAKATPTGKLALYTACADDRPPNETLPGAMRRRAQRAALRPAPPG